MELYKYNSLGGTPWKSGEMINGWDSVRWTERYQEAGEFEIKAQLSSGLRSFLPLGVAISHVDTEDVMLVENHEVEEEEDGSPYLKITGRDFTSFYENRIVGAGLAHGNPAAPPSEFSLSSADLSGEQIANLILAHTDSSDVVDPNDALPYHLAVWVSGSLAVPDRVVKRQTLYKAVVELCKSYDLGARVRHIIGDDDLRVEIHEGENKASEVAFTWDSGELKSVHYLFSIRGKKNVALVRGKWIEEFVYSSGIGYDRRVLLVEAPDLDETYETAADANTAATTIRAKMTVRGQEALDSSNEVNITQVEISEGAEYVYRRDYNIGDIVSVKGNYEADDIRRVTEYTEIEDENGESGHPTLSVLA